MPREEFLEGHDEHEKHGNDAQRPEGLEGPRPDQTTDEQQRQQHPQDQRLGLKFSTGLFPAPLTRLDVGRHGFSAPSTEGKRRPSSSPMPVKPPNRVCEFPNRASSIGTIKTGMAMWPRSRIDDIATSGSDLLLVVEAQGPLAGVPIVLFSALLLLQGHRRLPVTAFAIGAAAGYVLAPNLLGMLASVGVDSPLDMAQSQLRMIIGVMMVSVAHSLRMMAGLLAFIGITAGVQALYVRGIDIEQGEFIPIIAAWAARHFTRSVRLLLHRGRGRGPGWPAVGVFILLEMPVMTPHPGLRPRFGSPSLAGMSFVYQHRAAKKRAQKKELEA